MRMRIIEDWYNNVYVLFKKMLFDGKLFLLSSTLSYLYLLMVIIFDFRELAGGSMSFVMEDIYINFIW